MSKTKEAIDLARQLITTTTLPIDMIIANCGISHAQYRKVYPETPITPALALDIIDSRDVDGFTLDKIRRVWNLSVSQLNYALYNPAATTPKEVDRDAALARDNVILALQESQGKRSQTDIAEEHNVSQSFVHKIAKEINMLPKRKKRVTLTEEQWQEIKQRSAGTPIEQLAKEFSVSRDTIYKGLRSMR